MTQRIYINELHEHIDETIVLKGWVHVRRDHGKLIFLDLRDVSGLVQIVALPNHKDVHAIAGEVRPEWVVEIKGKVKLRPERMINSDEINGDIEIEVLGITVLNESETPPFEISEDTKDIDENVRLKYRYLDLRTARLQKNIKLRNDFSKNCRDYLHENRFLEIETPLLTGSTAEGSRDFVVPSRINKGKFYALPQSPQQYKQLLMTASFDRYFQMARAIRDEDLRSDRAFEHTQIDIEMSFVTREDVMNVVETMVTQSVEKMGYKIKEKPFPRITYKESMERYGEDKFDLRSDEEKKGGVLAYAWVIDFPMFEKTDEGKWTFSHNPFSMPKSEFEQDLLNENNIENIISTQYDLVCNGYETGGGSIRAHRPELLLATYKIMGYEEEEIQEKVGHMLEAFKYGAPPHGGIALGLDRMIMNLTGEKSIKEVQAFPMTRTGQVSVMNGPSELNPEQLTELGVRIIKNE